MLAIQSQRAYLFYGNLLQYVRPSHIGHFMGNALHLLFALIKLVKLDICNIKKCS